MDESSPAPKKSQIQLITIDADQKLAHFDGCKITINKIATCLLMEPQIEQIKVLVANFDKSFYRFKNILCIIDTVENIYNFMLILRSVESCRKTFDAIQKTKEIKDTNLLNVKLFQQLIFPILKEIQLNETLKAEIKSTLRRLFKSFNHDEKEKCYNYLKKIQMDESFIVGILGENFIQTLELKTIRKRTLQSQTTVANGNNELSGDSYNNLIVLSDGEESGNERSPQRKRNHIETDSNEIIVKPPNFEIISFTENGIEKKRLFIFDKTDKNKCYEYCWNNSSKCFTCFSCESKKKRVSTKIYKENGEEYVKLKNHVCELRAYDPKKYVSNIIKAPNFKVINFKENGIFKKRLFVFHEKNKKKCYEYYWQKRNNTFKCLGCHCKNKTITANIYKENGEKYVKLNRAKHICDIRDYDPYKYSYMIVKAPKESECKSSLPTKRKAPTETVKDDEIIIRPPNFKIINYNQDGSEKKRLFIFDEKDNTKCYEYSWAESRKHFICYGCIHKKKFRYAKLFGEYVKIKKSDHVCDLRDYNPDQYLLDSSKIIESSNFKVVNFNGKPRLLIFLENDKTKCYEYFLDKRQQCFQCLGCVVMKKRLTAKVFKENEKEYVKLNNSDHVCEIRDYNSDKYICGSFDMIKAPNFKVINFTENDINKKRLLIFDENDKTKCYEYSWYKANKRFVCLGCANKKKNVSTKIYEENGEEYVKLKKFMHICELENYNPDKYLSDPPRIIQSPNFKIINFNQSGISKSRLFVFSSEDKSMGYEYYWTNSHKAFRCGGCEKMDKHITATICKNENGEDCVKLCKRDHFCEALKYESRNYDFDSTKQIYEGTDFEIHDFQDRGILRKWIVIFPLIDDRSKCYEYSWAKGVKKYECKGCLAKKRRVSAELCQKEDGTKYVKIGPRKHICELRKYNPQKFTAEEFVEAPNFEIINFEENGVSKQRLFIFANSEKTKCYEFYWRNVGKYFACGACEGKDKHTAAKLEERNDGTKYIRLLSSLHICEMKDYIPDKYSLDETKRIVEKPNFEIFDYQRNNISKSMLVIFCPTNKELCYEYFFDKSGNNYVCCGCANIIHVTAKLCKKENGEEFVKLNRAEHVCELRQFDPEKFTDYLTLTGNDYEKLEYSYNGILFKRLFIFTSNTKEFCYKFNFNPTENSYCCSKCRQKRHSLQAFIRKNDGGIEYISLSNRKHLCEPIKYIPKTRILAPNFQLLKRKTQNLIVQKLAIFTDSILKNCYEYRQAKTNFMCSSHHKFKCSASAKIIKNAVGEECAEMSYMKHKCKPIKFIPEGSLDFKIVKKPDFKLKGNVLSVFDKNDKTKCFTYNWRERGKYYQCYSCRSKNESLSVVARIKQDSNGEDYVLLNDNEHICSSKKYKQV